jgi:hypothetical protein
MIKFHLVEVLFNGIFPPSLNMVKPTLMPYTRLNITNYPVPVISNSDWNFLLMGAGEDY